MIAAPRCKGLPRPQELARRQPLPRGAAARPWVPAALLAAILLLLAPALPAPALADEAEALYTRAATEFHRLRRQDPERIPSTGQGKGWSAAGRRFLAVHEAYPNHRRGPDALFSAGLAYREAYAAGRSPEHLSEGVALFHRFVNTYPRHGLADDCLIHIGEIFAQDYGDPQVAYLEYRKVWELYPDGDQAPLARKRAKALEPRLRNILAPSRAEPAEEARATAAPKAAEAAAVPGRTPSTTLGVTLKRIQYLSAPEWTRVILTVSEPVEYRHARLPAAAGKPERVYVDLPNAVLAADLKNAFAVWDSRLKRIRVGQSEGGRVRVVFDLDRVDKLSFKQFQLPRESKIVLDLHTAPAPLPPPTTRLSEADPPAPETARSLNRALGLKVRTIVLDPGHGGRDPGATAFGLKEKQVVVEIAKALREIFRRERPDIRVVLTREDDRFIRLSERSKIAHRLRADLFVSIHVNAHEIERFFGIETYFLNLTSDASALRVAARENASTEMQVGDLNAILLDLLRDTNIIESGALAKTLQTSLVSRLKPGYGVRDLGVKQAPFMVLLGSEVPSVLVEAGFITNRKENGRLKQRAYLQQIAQGIYEGLDAYIDQQTLSASPPPSPAVARN